MHLARDAAEVSTLKSNAAIAMEQAISSGNSRLVHAPRFLAPSAAQPVEVPRQVPLMLSLFLKSLLGALAVLLIALLSRSKSFFIAGLVPLFPTFALIAHFIVGSERSAADLRLTALFGLWSMLPYAVYLLVVYWLSVRNSLVSTLVWATFAWLACAAAILIAWSRTFAGGSGA